MFVSNPCFGALLAVFLHCSKLINLTLKVLTIIILVVKVPNSLFDQKLENLAKILAGEGSG